MEEKELEGITFQPQTNWRLAKEKRRLAQEQVEQREYDAERLSLSKQRIRNMEPERQCSGGEDLRECTFAPRTTWNLVKERRRQARLQREHEAYEAEQHPKRVAVTERELRDRRFEEEELKFCTFKPQLTLSAC